MALSNFRSYFNIGDALVDFATLKAAGLNPVFHNENHAYINSLQLIAIGGLIIMLPKSEHNEANHALRNAVKQPITDYDPIVKNKYGQWIKGSVIVVLFFLGSPFLLPVLFLPLYALFGLAVVLLLLAFAFSSVVLAFLGITIAAILPILWHAKHRAIPNINHGVPS